MKRKIIASVEITPAMIAYTKRKSRKRYAFKRFMISTFRGILRSIREGKLFPRTKRRRNVMKEDKQ